MNAENEAALDAGNVEGREKTDDTGTIIELPVEGKTTREAQS